MASLTSPGLREVSLLGPEDGNEGTELQPAPLSWFEEESPSSFEKTNGDKLSIEEDDSDDSLILEEETNSLDSTGMAGPPAVGEPLPAPSWKEISCEVLPTAARELLSSTMHRVCHTAHLTYARGRWQRNYSDLGNNAVGYFRQDEPGDLQLPPFSSLRWVDRQLVQEWRSYTPEKTSNVDDDEEEE